MFLYFPFVLFLDLLNPSCLGDPEPPFCFPHPGRPPEGPAPRGKAEAKKPLSRILAPKAEAALITLQYFQTRLFFSFVFYSAHTVLHRVLV